MPHHAVRNRVMAGGFLVLALVGAIAVLILLGGWETWFQDTQTLRVRFESAPNLKVGSPVLLAGHPVGRVEDTRLVESPSPPGEPRRTCYLVEVTCGLPRTYAIYKNARIIISQALVGQSASLNIEDIGFGEKATDFVMGEQASPFAAAAGELGIGAREKKSIAETIESLRAAVADLRIIVADAKALVATNRGNLAATIQNFRQASEHLKALAKEVRRSPWRLFAKPDKQEVESLNLYDTARAFASAASDLDSLAETLRVMMEAKKEGVEVDPKVFQEMLKQLEEMFGRYKEAEGTLLKEFDRIQKK